MTTNDDSASGYAWRNPSNPPPTPPLTVEELVEKVTEYITDQDPEWEDLEEFVRENGSEAARNHIVYLCHLLRHRILGEAHPDKKLEKELSLTKEDE